MGNPIFHDSSPNNESENPCLDDVVKQVLSRRKFLLKSGGSAAAVAFLSSGVARAAQALSPTNLIGFQAISIATDDAIHIAPGYTARSFVPWGTPIFSSGPGSQWRGDGSESAQDQARQVGDNHDGIHFFPLDNSSREGLLVMNHEYSTTVGDGYDQYLTLFGKSPTVAKTVEQVDKAINAWGCSVLHVRRAAGDWALVKDSKYNRRMTSGSAMVMTGPAAGHDLLKTKADPTGTRVLGTINNCGNGYTPWGTYLTCEENWNNNFGTRLGQGDERTPAQKRYGLAKGATGYGWEAFHDRFDYKKEPNESNRFGWIVEIDPYNPESAPKKRTALGRFKHENAAYAISKDNRVVIYMGDDERFDYIYKFVSAGKYREGDRANNMDLLDTGTLYVAQFSAKTAQGEGMGDGQWIELSMSNPKVVAAGFKDLADVLVHARLVADAVGATKMDRPEWITVHPTTQEVYATLTNNSRRKSGQEDAVNPRADNVYGQIVRWREASGDAAALRFDWDLFVLGGNPAVNAKGDLKAGSPNVTADNMFNSPDGLGFDKAGRLWIQTDGNYSNAKAYAGMGNNQMLCADPKTKEIRRFLVGPKECEITGLTFTPDQKTLFINVQHPGERGNSHWPDGGDAIPRSATVVITKDDGGVIGS